MTHEHGEKCTCPGGSCARIHHANPASLSSCKTDQKTYVNFTSFHSGIQRFSDPTYAVYCRGLGKYVLSSLLLVLFLLMKDTSVKRLNIERLGSYHRKMKAKHYCKQIKSMNSSEMGNNPLEMPFVIFLAKGKYIKAISGLHK